MENRHLHQFTISGLQFGETPKFSIYRQDEAETPRHGRRQFGYEYDFRTIAGRRQRFCRELGAGLSGVRQGTPRLLRRVRWAASGVITSSSSYRRSSTRHEEYFSGSAVSLIRKHSILRGNQALERRGRSQGQVAVFEPVKKDHAPTWRLMSAFGAGGSALPPPARVQVNYNRPALGFSTTAVDRVALIFPKLTA